MNIENLTKEQRDRILEFGVNKWYVMELLKEYVDNPLNTSEEWKEFFESINILPAVTERKPLAAKESKTPAEVKTSKVKLPSPGIGEDAVPIRGAGVKIIENMDSSLSIPVATSFRALSVKVLEENRRILNKYLTQSGRSKVSFTHIIGWAIVKAIKEVPVMNNAFTIIDGEPNLLKRNDINVGLAIDVIKKDGSRSLIVPNIKGANKLNFKEYYDKYNDIISRSRKNKIEVADFQGTTISLTNPGTIGTLASQPRLMVGQGAIIATGNIDYPPGFQGASEEVISKLGISKVMNITSTYDHRIIQGAESGLFLKKISELITGEDGFYEEVFKDLDIPMKPVLWKSDFNTEVFSKTNNLDEIEKHTKLIQLINMFRVRGHLLASLDPLTLRARYHPELDAANYGFTVWDYEREFVADGLGGMRTAKLRDILDMLQQTYCNKIGVEYRHIQDPEEKLWLQHNMESIRNTPEFNSHIKKQILKKLIQAENFEKYIDKKYLGHKRFSLEGSETIIPALDFLLMNAAEDEVEEVVFGMSHRGRLNVLANIIGKPLYAIFSEFEDIVDPSLVQGSGDVKYHLGASGIYKTLDDDEIKVTVASNPSHLEFVNPVVEGIVRAKQTNSGDEKMEKFIPVLLHGDAAFAGEGVVAETLNLSQLAGYKTGGTIHIIVNNQIGFTTTPKEARSSQYCTDVARMVQAPIFHVNGDDPEASLWTVKLAYEFRMKFKKDVVIDIYAYRRLGHNESDEPAFTQPVMYKAIRKHDSVKEIYSNHLINTGVITETEFKDIEDLIMRNMEKDYEMVHGKEKVDFSVDIPLAVEDEKIEKVRTGNETGINKETLEKIVKGLTTLPETFRLHPKLNKFIESRKELLTKDNKIDWAFAEAIAFGSLLLEGVPVRLSGQDSGRGTFSQRHAILTDSENGNEYIPLNYIESHQAKIEALDSLLSEAAVLGYEYGYSVSDPVTLVIWEAQFGDFANAAQVLIDNFIASSYTKWKLPNSVVMLLPHGLEGQGAEHSSARLERFLILCAEDNMTVCNPTTPAQYFHLLRRQMKSQQRRPLVIMSPKSLLRHLDAKSSQDEFLNGEFNEVIDDNISSKDKIEKVILTSGKIYYDLIKHRNANKITDTAIIRIEQYYPYPEEQINSIIKSYKNAKKIRWVQEEPENMGAYYFIMRRLINDKEIFAKFSSITRKPSASPAPGSFRIWEKTQKDIIEKSFE